MRPAADLIVAGHEFARIAQLVERHVEGVRAGGSNPSPGTNKQRHNIYCSMGELIDPRDC